MSTSGDEGRNASNERGRELSRSLSVQGLAHPECKRTMNSGCLSCFGTGVVDPQPCRFCGTLTRETAFNVPAKAHFPCCRGCPRAK